ncbi:adenosylmethionine decarboxylase [Frankia sp. Ag45/Mut15]|uniref:Adenosylmethionine decarboxylase n=1 Tax=Frankia umida TaxID=573489 RepID=A0ABT0JWM2_9ACTN|nr:adenosylmethionine decarboxylase [Frankia umida]MCK9875403.1 adenosylmethionine decarboxylase [Frankia umida]
MIHAIFDVTACHPGNISADHIMDAMRETARQLGCTIRSHLIEPFQPHGATCVLILAESHITVSTWPEHRLAHIDIFTCRADIDPHQAVEPILIVLGGHIGNTKNIVRLSPENRDELSVTSGPISSY